MEMTTEYDQQAAEFLASFGVELAIEQAPALDQTPPPWSDSPEHGIRYRCRISRGGRSYSFDFWGSIADRENGTAPSEYAVLASLEAVRDMTADDVWQNFGEMSPSRCEAYANQCREVARVMSGDAGIRAINEIW